MEQKRPIDFAYYGDYQIVTATASTKEGVREEGMGRSEWAETAPCGDLAEGAVPR